MSSAVLCRAVGQRRRVPHPVTCDLLHLLPPPLFLPLEMISCSRCKMSPGFKALTAKELVGWHVVSGVTALAERLLRDEFQTSC